MGKEETVHVSARIPKRVVAELDRIAHANHRSRTGEMIAILVARIEAERVASAAALASAAGLDGEP